MRKDIFCHLMLGQSCTERRPASSTEASSLLYTIPYTL